MNKCSSYDVAEEIVGWYTPNSPKMALRSRCFGTRERDECTCGGDRSKCDFYPEVREKAQEEVQISLLDNGNGYAIGKTDWNPYESIIINTDKLKLYHKDLDIEIQIPDGILSKIEIIEINGYKFVKEKS